MMKGYVYIMANKTHSTLYVGVTADIMKRTAQHKSKYYPNSFSARYNCFYLVYWREFTAITDAIQEEKRIKAGSRQQKVLLINQQNPDWLDLANDWY